MLFSRIWRIWRILFLIRPLIPALVHNLPRPHLSVIPAPERESPKSRPRGKKSQRLTRPRPRASSCSLIIAPAIIRRIVAKQQCRARQSGRIFLSFRTFPSFPPFPVIPAPKRESPKKPPAARHFAARHFCQSRARGLPSCH